MRVEYYRCWPGGSGDRGQWDTDYIEIPNDTIMTPGQLDEAIRGACQEIEWKDNSPPHFVGFYAYGEDEEFKNDDDDEGETDGSRTPN